MPAPGDQHSITANPFAEAKPRISEFTAIEIATLQSRLEKQLGPEYISARSGPSGQKVHYIAAEKCISLANEVFGFNGWSSSIQNIQVDFVDENPQTLKISLGLSVIMRVTLRDGTYHEDIGYGHIENCKGKAAAFEKAKKEGTTDALKRALRNFGNVLGNCIYDKDYLAKVTKIKVAPTKFEEANLHRHSDYAPKIEPEVKAEGDRNGASAAAANVSLDGLDEDDFGDFDMADFGVVDDGHPDEVALPAARPNEKPSTVSSGPSGDASRPSTANASGPPRQMQPPARTPLARSGSNGQLPRQPPQTPSQNKSNNRSGPQNQNQNQNRPQPNGKPQQVPAAQQAAVNGQVQTPPPANGGGEAPAMFFSARSITRVLNAPSGPTMTPSSDMIFNPKLESPSIKKTPGIDHNTSKPVGRNRQHVNPVVRADESSSSQRPGGVGPGSTSGPSRPAPGNVVNPSLNQARQIGAPGSHSPMANRGQYRSLTIKRPAPAADGAAATRTALNEVTNKGADAAADAKRQKVG